MDGDRSAGTLVLLRHGLSSWNDLNLSTGWVDVDLAPVGEQEARRAGELLVEHDLLPDEVHTSVLRRAIRTSHLALAAADRLWVPERRSWRLNERHYGALQGKDKRETLARFGEEQFLAWGRSYDVAPPPLPDDDEWSQAGTAAYADLPADAVPRTESLHDVTVRLLPYWTDAIVPALRAGRRVLVVAHGNSLRALVKHLDSVSDEAIAGVDIPTGVPLVYALGADLRPLVPSGEYLDPARAQAAIAAVREQGRA